MPKEKIERASALTESDKSGVRFDDLNAYFVEAIKCRDKGYFEAFIRAYEPVLQSRAERFVARYNLSADDTEDIKQIFLETLWFAFLGYDAADPIPLLQYVKKTATMRHLDYIRTTKIACTVPTQNGYTELRKVMRIYNTRLAEFDVTGAYAANAVRSDTGTIDASMHAAVLDRDRLSSNHFSLRFPLF